MKIAKLPTQMEMTKISVTSPNFNVCNFTQGQLLLCPELLLCIY